ncbi:MAG TPA: peptidoglycan DD-metalloendopeptidase family protein [Burkholderiales bacterium]|nr:peptidoglycan DD-metalloendopeptidase family protein [Burkholderiales bacterium]
MKRRVCAAALLFSLCNVNASEQDDLRALRERLQELRSKVADTEGAHAEAVDALRESETAISNANRALREQSSQQAQVESDLQRLSAEKAALNKNLDARQGELARILYARYVAGEPSLLRSLLSRDELGEAGRGLVYQSYLLRAQAALIGKLHEELARRRDLESRTLGKQQELHDLAAAQSRERQNLFAQAAEKRKLLAKLAQQIKQQRQALQSAQRSEARLARLVAEINKALSKKPKSPPPRQRRGPRNERVPDPSSPHGAFGSLKGRLSLPVPGELEGRFGTPRQGSGLASKGIFIRSREGVEVRAVAGGQVVFADWLRGFGNLLILDHGDGYMTVYGNNEAVLKHVGDAVKVGDAIATVGSSGGNETAGLYFEIRHQGQPFDPLPWVRLK